MTETEREVWRTLNKVEPTSLHRPPQVSLVIRMPVSAHNFLMTLIYSIFFGIFGCDRCNLDQRALGIFKLLTIGGLGFWWIIDTLLLIYGVNKPEDGINWDPYF